MPTSDDLRKRLTAASDHLRNAGAPELADAVDTVLAPQGWTRLRASDITASGTTQKNLPIGMDKELRDQIHEAVTAAGSTITADVNEAFVKYLAGEFVPGPPVRARRSATPRERANLNVRAPQALVEQVTAAGEQPARVASDYLMRKYNLGRYAPTEAAPLAPGAVRMPKVPRTLRDAIREAAAAAGNRVNTDVDEGFQKYLAGQFTPTEPTCADTGDMVPLKMSPNDDLYDQVRDRGGLRPSQVAIAYLLDKYGIDPTAL